MFGPEGGTHYSDAWAEAHRLFHRARLEGCGNAVLLETFDRMWTATELARRWSVHRTRTAERDVADEHQRLEQAVLARDTETAARQLAQHLALTAAALGTPATAVHRDLPQIL